MTTTPPIPAFPAATAKTLPDIAAKYRTVPTTLSMSFTLDKEIADNVTAAEMRELQKLIGMGYRAAREEIAGDVANAAHLAEQWRGLRKAKADAEANLLESSCDHREYSDCSVVDDDAMEMWQRAIIALATFEQQHQIGGGA